MTAFEVPIYPEESPGIPHMYDNKVSDEDDYPSNADVVTEFERAMRGVRALVGGPVQYPPKLAANSLYGKRDQAVPTYHCDRGSECTRTLTCQGLHTEVTICTGIETCKDPSHE